MSGVSRIDKGLVIALATLATVIFCVLVIFGPRGESKTESANVENSNARSQEAIERDAFNKIRMVEPQLTLNQVKASDLHPGLVEVYHNGQLRYVLGDLVIRGDLIDVDSGENVTQKRLASLQALAGSDGGDGNTAPIVAKKQEQSSLSTDPEPRSAPAESRDEVANSPSGGAAAGSQRNLDAALAILANQIIPDEMTVIYPAKGDEKHRITVFSDITCPVCTRNHEDFEELQSRGVTIRAALFPRRGMDVPEAEIMGKVLCGDTMDDRRDMLDRAYLGDKLEGQALCENGYLKNIRDIAVAEKDGLGVTSTPTLMASNGVRVDGYPRDNPVETIMGLLAQRGFEEKR